jgi:hypothetical protein
LQLKRTLGALDDMGDDAEMFKRTKVVVDLPDFLQALDQLEVGPGVSVKAKIRESSIEFRRSIGSDW